MSNFFWPPLTSAGLSAVLPTDITGVGLYHAAASNNITGSFAEVAGSGNGSVPSGTKKIQVSSTIGAPISISIAASSGVAAASTKIFYLVAGGGPLYIEHIAISGDKLFVKTLDGSTQSVGDFVVNFTG